MNLPAALEHGERRHMGKASPRANLGKAVLVLHIAIVRPKPCIQGRKAGKIVPIDIFVYVLAPRRLIETIERIFERRNAMAQREPVHVEQDAYAVRRLSAFAHARTRLQRREEGADRPAERQRNVCKRVEQSAFPRKP